MQEILDRMQALQAQAEAKDVTSLESRAEKVMDLMGFDSIDAKLPVSSFSGGWKMRIGLGKVLLKDPNVLLLDEPTNHLDMESVEWLEDFLRNQNIPMVIVSHDREFLDQVCTKIVDTEGGLATSYDGNYSRFLKQKSAKMKAWQSKWDAQEKKVKEEKVSREGAFTRLIDVALPADPSLSRRRLGSRSSRPSSPRPSSRGSPASKSSRLVTTT